jgi:hypothetical protein
MADAVGEYPRVVLDPAGVRELAYGRTIPATGLAGPVAAVDHQGELVAMVADRDARARPLVVLAAVPGADGGGAPDGG